MLKPDWLALIPALQRGAQEMLNSTEFEYAKKNIPCVFLKNEECSVYAKRPAVCRFYFVITPPEDCDATKSQKEVQAINLDEAAEAVWGTGNDWILAPFPFQMLRALRLLAKTKKYEEQLDNALLGLDPKQWSDKARAKEP